MSNLAPPGTSSTHNMGRKSNASHSDVAVYKDTVSVNNSTNSRRRSETERPLPKQVSAAFDDRSSSNADSGVMKLNRN